MGVAAFRRGRDDPRPDEALGRVVDRDLGRIPPFAQPGVRRLHPDPRELGRAPGNALGPPRADRVRRLPHAVPDPPGRASPRPQVRPGIPGLSIEGPAVALSRPPEAGLNRRSPKMTAPKGKDFHASKPPRAIRDRRFHQGLGSDETPRVYPAREAPLGLCGRNIRIPPADELARSQSEISFPIQLRLKSRVVELTILSE